MRGLRIAHRLSAMTAIGAGLIGLPDAFAGEFPNPAVWVWLIATVGVIAVYRRMRFLAYRNDSHHQTSEEH